MVGKRVSRAVAKFGLETTLRERPKKRCVTAFPGLPSGLGRRAPPSNAPSVENSMLWSTEIPKLLTLHYLPCIALHCPFQHNE